MVDNNSDKKYDMGLEFSAFDSLTADDFSQFFRDVHNLEPFPWQIRLANQVLNNNGWPKVIDLPTGTGKTATLDIALFALAVNPSISSRRIIFVVDRRIVVDQVYVRAKKIREKIDSRKTKMLRKLSDRINSICPDGIGVVALRGGIPIDNEWTTRPDQPWVIVSTIDQFGSRLLFRGYGVSRKMRPIHAGLAGNDCLVILDEVHLSAPFKETLQQVTQWETSYLPRRFAVVQMSATPIEDAENCFRLITSDLTESEELNQRVNAVKHAKLEEVSNVDEIPNKVKNLLASIKKSDSQVSCIGVIVNRVRTARDTYNHLSESGFVVHLITGRMRPLDRVEIVSAIESMVDPNRSRSSRQDRFTIVVATQAIEVGADFDFDALITECASFDSLQQRFGRLDRRGKLSAFGKPARAWILGITQEIKTRGPDPIYGEALKTTWNELNSIKTEKGYIDISWNNLKEKLPSTVYSTPDVAPVMLKTHMDCFVQTYPEPLIQPNIDAFLHGLNQESSEPDISIVWRLDDSLEGLTAVPPRRAEFMQVPISAVKAWLKKENEFDLSDTSRTYRIAKKSSQTLQQNNVSFKCIRWHNSKSSNEKVEDITNIKDIHPGDILVLNSSVGGISSGTWDPNSKILVTDLGDQAQFSYGRKATLRLNPELHFCSISPPMPSDEIISDTPLKHRINEWLKNVLTDKNDLQIDWLRFAVNRLLENGFDVIFVDKSNNSDGIEGYYVLTERNLKSGKRKIDEFELDSSDESNSLTGSAITLKEHLEGVGNRAESIATRLQLSNNVIADLKLAGRLHDIGKVDQRFQQILVGGDPIAYEMHSTNPLAKSLPQIRRIRSDYPTGMRHEIASVAMIESNYKVIVDAHDPDLVLHLVGAHHGRGRPLLPVVEDDNPQMLEFSFGQHRMAVGSHLVNSNLALKMNDRFWKLTEHYGFYGLAWLETILRLADHQQSVEETNSK